MDVTARYAQRAVRTWIDAFMLSGSTTRGDLLTVSERAATLDLWLEVAPASRLLATCWVPDDVEEARRRDIQPIVVLRDLRGRDEALAHLHTLTAGTYVYSHPMFTQTTFGSTVASAARRLGILPSGAKIAKISIRDIARIRDAAGSAFTLWDGSSRHIRASIEAGASGVVATPLCALPSPFPRRLAEDVQASVDRIQALLDRIPSRGEKLTQLTGMAR